MWTRINENWIIINDMGNGMILFYVSHCDFIKAFGIRRRRKWKAKKTVIHGNMQKFLCQFTELRTVAFMEIMIFCVKDAEWKEILVGEQWHSIEMMAYFKFKSELQSHTYILLSRTWASKYERFSESIEIHKWHFRWGWELWLKEM